MLQSSKITHTTSCHPNYSWDQQQADVFLVPRNLFVIYVFVIFQSIFNKYLLKAVYNDDGIIKAFS